MKLVALQTDSITKGSKFVLTSGGFESFEAASEEGRKFKGVLYAVGAKLRVGIDAGKDEDGLRFSGDMVNTLLQKTGYRVVGDVHGVSVQSEDCPIRTVDISGVASTRTITAEQFCEALGAAPCSYLPIDDKTALSLELYGASHYETSTRAIFLTRILAVEALLEPRQRPLKTRAHLDELVALTKASSLASDQKDSILGSLRWLYVDSISKSLKQLADRYLAENTYNGMSASRFISECYGVRSSLVHTGRIDEQTTNLDVLTDQLGEFVADLLTSRVTKR